MTKRKNLHTNITLENSRRERVYQAVITDLAITGNIAKEDAEMLLGYEIPTFLHTPDNRDINGVVKTQGSNNILSQLKKV